MIRVTSWKKELLLFASVILVGIFFAVSYTHLATASSSATIAPFTETDQLAYFYGVPANQQFQVRFTVYHYEGDPTPYTLGTNAYSSSNGIAKANAAIGDLAAFYNGGEGPIYEVKACIYAESDTINPLDCTPDTYVGWYPESLWYYNGTNTAKVRR